MELDTTPDTAKLSLSSVDAGRWPNKIMLYEKGSLTGRPAFELSWKIKIDGGNEVEFAKSKHQVYVTRKLPLPSTSNRRESLFYWACEGAIGQPLEYDGLLTNEIFDTMFKLKPEHLQRIDPDTGQKDGEALKFAGANGLFSEERAGMCEPWAMAFRDTVAIHGIEIQIYDINVPNPVPPGKNGGSFYVKTHIDAPYPNFFEPAGESKGQGGAQEQKSWPGHTICIRNNECYDASYGLRADTRAKYELAAFSGYTQNTKIIGRGKNKSEIKALKFDGLTPKLNYVQK